MSRSHQKLYWGAAAHHLVDIVEQSETSPSADKVDEEEQPEIEAFQALPQGHVWQLQLLLLPRRRRQQRQALWWQVLLLLLLLPVR